MSPFKFILAASVCLVAAPAAAQTVNQPSSLHQEAPVRVQTSFNIFVPGPTGDSEEAQKLRDDARRSIYAMAARECGLLREVLAKDCRLESISSNIGRQPYNTQQPEGYTFNGSMSLQIIIK